MSATNTTPEKYVSADSRPRWRPVPILMYHAVESKPRPPKYKHFYVTAREFSGQMEMLRRNRFTPITFNQLEEAKLGKTALPKRPVLLTFDDGYTNLLDNVHPLLRGLGFPYTVFLVSNLVGHTNAWVTSEGYNATPLLSWSQIEQMQADGGVSFQPHTVSHPHLTQISQDEARREMRECKETLEQKLQIPMRTLCYPYGDHNHDVRLIAADLGYTSAVTTEFGRVRLTDHPLRLPRISVYHVPPVSLTYGVGSLNFRWRIESRKDTRTEH